MNYIWDVIVNFRQNGRQEKNVKFLVAKSYSPYMELSDPSINFDKVEEELEVNPYYRFYEIFKDLFNINYEDEMELRETFFDIIIHFLADVDTLQGMTKREFYIRFVLEDIEKGILGTRIKESFALFDLREKTILVENLIKLYKTGQALYLLMNTVRSIFRNSTIYVNYEVKDQLLYYVPYKRSKINEAKMAFIEEFFLPINFRTEVFWEEHFGVIEVYETMKIDSIALY